MTTRRKKLLAVLLIIGIATLFCGYQAVRRIADVAALQDSLERDWEILFDGKSIPSVLTPSIDRAAESLIRRYLAPDPEYLFLGQKPNRAEALHDQFMALFRGRITEMEIYYPGRMRADLGAALARFRSLRRLKIQEADFSEKEWAYVFTGLQQLPYLEELDIGGQELRDRTLEPLAHMRSLRKVTISFGRVAPECAETFARMPRLTELTFAAETVNDGHKEPEPPLPESQKMLKEALPQVKINFL